MPCVGRVGGGKRQKRVHFLQLQGVFNDDGTRGMGTKKARSYNRAQMTNSKELTPSVPSAFQVSNSLSPYTLATFSAAVFARFFVALLQLQSSEKAIILYLLLQDFHGPFYIVINDPDF